MVFFIRKTSLVEWLTLALATVLLFWPGFATDGAGLVLVAAIYLSQRYWRHDEPRPLAG
jgi:UPF0716 family protein affecting phage T7 exclusion